MIDASTPAAPTGDDWHGDCADTEMERLSGRLDLEAADLVALSRGWCATSAAITRPPEPCCTNFSSDVDCKCVMQDT
jgi:hypothetical protein